MIWWRSGSGVPSNARSRFCRTVIQGNTEPRWAIMIPRRLGARTGRPSINTAPRSGRSNPASTLSRVDFPQPDGPTIATNSPAPTVKDMSSRADTSPSPVPNVFHTPWTETSAPTSVPPADLLQVLQASHDEVQQQSDDADHDHSRDDEVIPHAGIAEAMMRKPEPEVIATISAATTTSQATPNPTRMPVKIVGRGAG